MVNYIQLKLYNIQFSENILLLRIPVNDCIFTQLILLYVHIFNAQARDEINRNVAFSFAVNRRELICLNFSVKDGFLS